MNKAGDSAAPPYTGLIMPQRSKHDAEIRMSIGVARVALRAGKSPEEAVQMIKDQLRSREGADASQASIVSLEKPPHTPLRRIE